MRVELTCLVAAAALLVLTGPPAAEAQDSYIIGEEEDTGPDLGSQFGRFVKLRDHRYSERFAVERLAVASDGSEIVALTKSSREGPRSWDLGTGRSRKLPPMSRDAATPAWSPAKDLLAVTVLADVLSGARAGVEVLRMEDGGSEVFLIGGESSRSLAFSPDGRHLAGASTDGVLVWALPGGKGQVIHEVPGGADAISWIAPGELVVASDGGQRVERVTVSGQVLNSWDGARGEDGVVGFSPTGRYLVTGHEGEIKLHDLQRPAEPQRVLLKGGVTSIAWSLSGEVLAVGTDIGLVHVFAVDGIPGIPWTEESTTAARGAARARPGSDPQPQERDERYAERERERDAEEDLRTLGIDREERGGSSTEPGPSDLEASLSMVVLGAAMGSDPRDGKSLESSLERNMKRVEKCWKGQIRGGKVGSGRLVLGFSVNANGEGVGIGAPVEDTLANDKILSCLEERLREPLFGSGLGSIDVEFTLVLE